MWKGQTHVSYLCFRCFLFYLHLVVGFLFSHNAVILGLSRRIPIFFHKLSFISPKKQHSLHMIHIFVFILRLTAQQKPPTNHNSRMLQRFPYGSKFGVVSPLISVSKDPIEHLLTLALFISCIFPSQVSFQAQVSIVTRMSIVYFFHPFPSSRLFSVGIPSSFLHHVRILLFPSGVRDPSIQTLPSFHPSLYSSTARFTAMFKGRRT